MKTQTKAKTHDWRPFVRRAIAEFGHNALAVRMDISPARLSWIVHKQTKPPSGELAIAFERGTEGKIKKADIRPDLFGDAVNGAAR